MENHCSIPFFTTTLTFCLASISDEVSWKIVREKQIGEKQIAPSVLAEKTDDVSRCHHRFPHEMTSDRETSAKIPYSWRVTFKITVVLLIGWKFPSTNHKHYPDLGSDASTVWNFCACFSDVISRVVASHNVGCFVRLHHPVYIPQLSNNRRGRNRSVIVHYKITKIVRALWLAASSVCMRVCRHL